ncbi:NrfD/PsrC family molybdoenzyme membrane anchor subunit, partial [Salmonella enterica]|uniref:NrfD/PsrC family molybdoenzyme membrane anchor subunit n=1 Tax=Salmonella enterica TaxID=28901 RepID=UPI003298B588
ARPIWFSYALPVAMFLSALQAFFGLMIVAARRDSVRLRKILWGQIWTLAGPALVVAMWASGDPLSGTAIRPWIS